MSGQIKFNIDDRQFQATLRQYGILTKRSIPVIVNTKAFYIARRSVRETPAVTAGEIRQFIKLDGGVVIGKIINARRGAKGEKGLYGDAMAKAVDTVLKARLRSRAFLKSGWLWAVKKLAPYAEKIGSLSQGSARASGTPKGGAIPAQEGWSVVAKIMNNVTAAWDDRDGAAKYAVPALQRAIDAEEKSMRQYIERKMWDNGKILGIKMK